MVNGEPITNYDIEQRTKLDFLTTHKKPTRQEVINELIDEKVKIKEAKKFGVDPTASDIDQSYAAMSSRMRITPDQLTKSLESQGIRPDTLKARIKAEMVWGSLVRGRFKESLQVGEKDVAAAVQAKAANKPQTESFEYQMQPIVLIVPRGSAPARSKRGRRKPKRCASASRPARRPIPISSRCRTPRSATPSPRPRPISRPASRTARQDPDRPSDRARDHQAGRGDGGAVRAQADHHRHAEEAGNPREDVRGEIRGEVESLSAAKSAKPR